LAQREYSIPGSHRRCVGKKTIEAWYYAWRHHGVNGLEPKIRSDRGQSKLAPEVQAAIIQAKEENPKRSIRKIMELMCECEQVCPEMLSRSSVHRLLQSRSLSHQPSSFEEQVENHFEVFNECFKNASHRNSSKEAMLLSFRWMLSVLQCQLDVTDLQKELGDIVTSAEIEECLRHIKDGTLSERNRAIAVLAIIKDIPIVEIADFLAITPAKVGNINKLFRSSGIIGLFGPRKEVSKKYQDTKYKDAVFALLHSPPKAHDINRTSWTLETLSSVLKESGLPVGEGTITKIIKDAGFKFRKAKKVLTSTDPEYKAKLHGITDILANLKPDEKFFSVDEYGPFSIKMQGGKSLVKPDQLKIVPQYQKSKGSLIVTAALELCENQVTHFYSSQKNTEEMLKLIEILITKYSDQSRIYFSWDAASWHASKKLSERLNEINSDEYRAVHKTPIVTLAPLPSCAQFLNVIESVFSGMARAIIHNSDYKSVEECQAAIDRYFADRNSHFKLYPSRAGNKIWGKERAPPVFSESGNCKDPLYR
jgi:transposase